MNSLRKMRRWVGEKIAGAALQRAYSNPIPGTECEHLWSNWSTPADIDRPFDAIGNWGAACHVTQEQHRTCFKCNLSQRSYT